MPTNDISRGSLIVAASIFTLAAVLAVRPLHSASPAETAAGLTAPGSAVVGADGSVRGMVFVPAAYEPAPMARTIASTAPAVLTQPVAVRPAARTSTGVARAPKRSWQKRTLVIGGSAGAGAAIGALIGGKKGALIGAAAGGGGGTLYEVLRHK